MQGESIPRVPIISESFAELTLIDTLGEKEGNKRNFLKKFIIIALMFVFLSLLAAFTYMAFEGFNFIQALYYAVTTAFGYEFFVLKSEWSVIVATIVLIGHWVFLWLLFELVVKFVVEGRFMEIMEGGHIKKTIHKMKDHFVICGAGRVGTEIARSLKASGQNFVIVDKDLHVVKQLHDKSLVVIQGDCLQEPTLKKAGIEKASTLIAAFGNDADNVFLTLTAKELNPNIRVIARAENPAAVGKLEQAGAEQVVLPSIIGGKAMADVALRHSLEFPGFSKNR